MHFETRKFAIYVTKGCLQKKKTSYGRKSSFLWGEGVRKKGQISLAKEQNKTETLQGQDKEKTRTNKGGERVRRGGGG